jgi:hypothetical protein
MSVAGSVAIAHLVNKIQSNVCFATIYTPPTKPNTFPCLFSYRFGHHYREDGTTEIAAETRTVVTGEDPPAATGAADLPMITAAAEEVMTIGAEATITDLPGEAPAAGAVARLIRITIPTAHRARGAAIPTAHAAAIPTAHAAEGVAHRRSFVAAVVVAAVVAAIATAQKRAFRESLCWCATSVLTSPITILAWRLGVSVKSAMSTSRGITTRSKRKALPLSSTPMLSVSTCNQS